MKVSLLEAPVCAGSPTVGSQYAFGHLIKNGFADIFGGARVVPMEKPQPCGIPENPRMKGAAEVMAVSRVLYENVVRELAGGYFPIVIGGDHSAAIGSVSGSAAETERLSVVYIDGHTDINTEMSSPSGFIHGMPLASAMGLCCDYLTVGKRGAVRGEDIYIIGARSIDEPEYPIISENGVHLYTADCVRERGISGIMDEVMGSIEGNIHVSFDVDFLDGDIFPSTGYRMPDGLDIETLYSILGPVFASGRVRSMDVVEYNPLLDAGGGDLCRLRGIFSHISELVG